MFTMAVTNYNLIKFKLIIKIHSATRKVQLSSSDIDKTNKLKLMMQPH